jgi:choline dehydrogenase-like flavoprotein
LTAAALSGEDDYTRISWDVIVVGTGMGGATLGHALAKAGRRVLFCERGRSKLSRAEAITGDYPEQRAREPGAVLDTRSSEMLSAAGRCASELIDESAARTRRFVPFIGSGGGGSTALYGMALERFAPSDFNPRSHHRDAAGSSLEESWPVGFDEFCAYYAAAEALYRVRGTSDPLSRSESPAHYLAPPPPLTPAAAELFGFFAGQGLHPYRLPLACEFVPGCQCCQGFLCAMDCKNDSARICLWPAVREFGASLADECEVVHVDADRSRATGVVCRWRGREVTFRGKSIVLAAGALQTPRLLLRSRSLLWPGGLANGSGMVGRNLMRHCIDLYVVEPRELGLGGAPENRFKEFAFNDFYAVDGVKLGSVQSFGRLPPGEMLFGSLKQDMKDGPLHWLAGGLTVMRPALVPFLKRMVDRSITLATTMEDLPYADNRVFLAGDEPDGAVRIDYRLRDADKLRIARFRSLMRQALKSRRWRLVKQAENNQRLAHACGTCRFGDDPKTSVLDENNRCHELENLYVVDSSFFPSSGGTNPGLTIAANALRVAARSFV